MLSSEFYVGREQTFVKHYVLENYLARLAFIVGGVKGWVRTFNYIDGFAGPWESATGNLADTSPHIAIARLRKVRSDLTARGLTPPKMRCLFVEKDPAAFGRLAASVGGVQDIHAVAMNGEFEALIPRIADFAREGEKPFSFVFIDPTGWSGYGLNTIKPILVQEPGEVLINFMTKDIIRFVDDLQSDALPTFIDLYGTDTYRDEWKGLQGLDREEAIVAAYCRRLKEACGFALVVSAVVLHPHKDRSHYHLVYGTRHRKGLRVFRDVERKAMEEQERVRAEAQQRERTKGGQGELFRSEVMAKSYYSDLRTRYLARSRQATEAMLCERRRVVFDELELAVLERPMTWASDLMGWLEDWRKQKKLRYEGLKPKERRPKEDAGHNIVWTATG